MHYTHCIKGTHVWLYAAQLAVEARQDLTRRQELPDAQQREELCGCGVVRLEVAVGFESVKQRMPAAKIAGTPRCPAA